MGSKILNLGESGYRPGTSGMQNGRSTIWASPPDTANKFENQRCHWTTYKNSQQ